MTSTYLGHGSTQPQTKVPAGKSFRPDLQGLRAIAVGLVLVYHAGAPFLPGGFVGVDVFFVISGFLITGILLREARRNQTISLAGFYARRANRILPAALIVLVATLVATFALLPKTRWDDIGLHVLGASLSVANWIFARTSTDYLRNDEAASPVQHFWTLGVEEQFYLLWPLLLVAALALAARGLSLRLREGTAFEYATFTRFALLAALLITVPSFAYSVLYTRANPGAAYFVTTTRMWELGIGCLIAILATRLGALPRAAATVLGLAGVAAMLAAGFLYSAETVFPGYAALLPTLGAAAVIIAGITHSTPVSRILSIRPMTFVGDISYSLYLWHWPLIVIGTYLLGGLTFAAGLVIISASLVPAYLSYRYVERPVLRTRRLARNSRALAAGLVAIVLVAVLAVGSIVIARPPGTTAGSASGPVDGGSTLNSTPPIGAQLLAADPAVGAPVDRVENFTPVPEAAPDDNPLPYADGCHVSAVSVQPKNCTYGDATSDYTVALVGDSHAAQWTPALTPLATANGWRLTTHTKSGCPLIDTAIVVDGTSDEPYESCVTWNSNVTASLLGDAPDFVVVSSALYRAVNGEPLSEAFARAWQPLLDAGIPVAVLADTPVPGIDIPECASVNPESLTECATPRSDALENATADLERAVRLAQGPTMIDLTDLICPQDRCAAVVGNVLVYRDSSHLTASYSRTLADALGDELAPLGVPVATDP